LLDAGGTLIEERVPRAAMYREAARRQGLDPTEGAVREHLYRAHAQLRRSELGAFRYSERWFASFNERVLCRGLGLAPERFQSAHAELLARFADPATFRVLPGARELLGSLGRLGIKRGVVSNWSERLPLLLESLSLGSQLEFCVVSAVEGCEKPEPEIFRRALSRAGCAADRAVYAGNELDKDVRAARAVGILAVLVGPAAAPADVPRVADLTQLTAWILARL
jgi:putative hydrolase of the HAD superfamily